MSNELYQAPRHETHCETILRMLKDQPVVTCDELMKVSKSHCRRISDLRDRGHLIDVEIVDANLGITHYRYRGHDPTKAREKKLRNVSDAEVIAHLRKIGAKAAGELYDRTFGEDWMDA